MTFSEEFQTTKGTETGEQPSGPVIFGITMTPLVAGIICGLLGIAGFAYIWSSFVSPVNETKKQLQLDKQDKENQVQQLKSGEAEKKIQQLKAELSREKELEPQVFAMFSDEGTLDTMLLDIYNLIQENNAELVTFKPEGPQATTITDGSLGKLVDNRLKRKTTQVEITGTFEQTQTIIRDIERLQPLLLIKDLETTVSEKPKYIYNQGRISIQGEPRLTSSFNIDAILPVDPDKLPKPEQPKAEGEDQAQPGEPQ